MTPARVMWCCVALLALMGCHGATKPDVTPSSDDVSSLRESGEAPSKQGADGLAGGGDLEEGQGARAPQGEPEEGAVELEEGEDDALDPTDIEVYEDSIVSEDSGEVSLTFTDDVDHPAFVVAEGFPAVSHDGQWVAVIDVDDDGARGNPNAALHIHSVSDGAVKESYPLLGADEFDSVAEDALPDLIIPRVDVARAALAKRPWRPMVALEVVDNRGVNGGASSVFSGPLVSDGDGPQLSLTLKASTLQISLAGAEVLSRGVEAWSAPPPPEGQESCEGQNPMTLLGGFWDAAHRVVTLEVGYLGNDECWEPDSEFRVTKY